MAVGGGGFPGGRVIGETSPDPNLEPEKKGSDVVDPQPVENLHATILHKLGIDFQKSYDTAVGRPMKKSEGKIIKELL